MRAGQKTPSLPKPPHNGGCLGLRVGGGVGRKKQDRADWIC